jgi:hypothetical protein
VVPGGNDEEGWWDGWERQGLSTWKKVVSLLWPRES